MTDDLRVQLDGVLSFMVITLLQWLLAALAGWFLFISRRRKIGPDDCYLHVWQDSARLSRCGPDLRLTIDATVCCAGGSVLQLFMTSPQNDKPQWLADATITDAGPVTHRFTVPLNPVFNNIVLDDVKVSVAAQPRNPRVRAQKQVAVAVGVGEFVLLEYMVVRTVRPRITNV